MTGYFAFLQHQKTKPMLFKWGMQYLIGLYHPLDGITNPKQKLLNWHNDTQHIDIQPNDTQPTDTQPYGTQPKDTQHKGLISDIEHNDTHHNDTQYNETLPLC